MHKHTAVDARMLKYKLSLFLLLEANEGKVGFEKFDESNHAKTIHASP